MNLFIKKIFLIYKIGFLNKFYTYLTFSELVKKIFIFISLFLL
jgi:hypothetical protein